MVALIILLVAILVAALEVRHHIGLLVLVVVQLVFVLAGLLLLEGDGWSSETPFLLFAAALGCLVAGYRLGHFVRSAPVNAKNPVQPSALPRRLVVITLVMVSVGAALHFALGGVPILSDNVEVERFDFSGSGLFGIPGRMYLYGLPLAWILAAVNGRVSGIPWTHDRVLVLATAALVTSRLLAGFKSGLIEVLTIILVTHIVTARTPLRVGELVKRYWYVAIPTLAYMLVTANSYGTYKRSGGSVWEQVLDRATIVAAEPVALTLEDRLVLRMDSVLRNDVQYFWAKYTGDSVEGLFTFDRLVSSSLLGFSPTSSISAPPVTITGFAEVVYQTGVWGGLFVMVLAGWALARLERVGRHSAAAAGACVVAAYCLITFLLKGSLVYILVNWSATVVFVLLVAVALYWLLGDPARGCRHEGVAAGRNQSSHALPSRSTRQKVQHGA